MTTHPKITALVPSYNHGHYIRERIESILNQTYPNIDLIVIDDCSNDDSHTFISELQARHGFQYLRNKRNSGSPFTAWERICALDSCDYIWVCESDDVAEPTFVETAVAYLDAVPGSVLFYCSSLIINEAGEFIGHTDSYFHDTWKETRWDNDFSTDGYSELLQFQLRGQTVPNMSSALFTTKAFKAAFTPFLKRLRLTGDRLFVGNVMKLGKVVFHRAALNRFRKHEITARMRVNSARSQAEYILTKYRLFRGTNQSLAAFAQLMSSDVIRFLYEPASWFNVVNTMFKVSWLDTLKFGVLILTTSCININYISKFLNLYIQSKKETIK